MRGRSFGLVLHPVRDVGGEVRTIVSWAREHGAEVVGLASDAARLGEGVAPLAPEDFVARCDAVISLGGDGTMLGALRLLIGSEVPVLGVNLGHLGFLVELEPRELPGGLARLAAGDFTVEPHSCLRISGPGLRAVAFNDLALTRTPGLGSASASLAVDGHRMGYYRCDALVLSTPTGSTAYNYAAGGPVVSPAADSFLVTPVAPMSGISRTLVLGTEESVRLELLANSGRLVAEVDGTVGGQLEPGASVDVRVERAAGHVIRLDAQGHGRRSRVKLSLLDLPLLPEEMRERLLQELLRGEPTSGTR
ncbi:NAD(+)/NADH kinase [Kineococcus glutinatus]|uniref:NAD(+)/NADH kinase n=1 Tax=Kineococcus glutinatus TaxID=1070872 RepID=UPI0031E6677F